jgi:cytochrome c oxidase subunit II
VRALALLAAALAATSVAGAQDEERIELTAEKFRFGVEEIRLKKGRRVTIVLTSPDFAHGFAVPELGVRGDAVPGKRVELSFTPDRAGRFQFLCDNFCGEDHDRMAGMLVVVED